MKYTTRGPIAQLLQTRVHLLVLLSLLGLALLGRTPEGQAGWITYPPAVVVAPQKRGLGGVGVCEAAAATSRLSGGGTCFHSGYVPLLRSVLLWGLWHLSGEVGPPGVGMVPWVLWGWQCLGWRWPRLRWQPEWQALHWLLWQGQRGLVVSYLGLTIGGWLAAPWEWSSLPIWSVGEGGAAAWLWLGLGCVHCGGEAPRVELVRQADGSYRGELWGHFTFQVAGGHPFRLRLMLLFLRLLEVPGETRGSRRTRDGRTPFVRQQYLAQVLGWPQPDISRIERYWLAGDWANLLSLQTPEVLTYELMGRIVAVFATFPEWGVEKVHAHLQQQGVAVTKRQVRQAGEQSGWFQLRRALRERYHWTPEHFRPREEWLVQQLLALVERLVAQREAEGSLPPEERVAIADLQTLAAEVGVEVAPPRKALPWLMRVERMVFGHWEAVTDGAVRCIYCGSTHVVRKSRKPRLKKYYDEEGKLQRVEVYRYYCRNPECDKGSFTNLPPGLVPYSRYRVEVHLLALQMYAWGYSTYRRTAMALGVAEMTVYRWVSAWGYELLPVAALFGAVKCSGVVGIDEKYVLVPKNDKPAGKMRRWMYVYFAVDVYTYDLLHIAIYPHNDQASAQAFLLTLRAKGYHPRVIVTDLRRDYGPLIAQVFPQAQHHECIFHALQRVQELFKEVYGADYAETYPEAAVLKEKIVKTFQARTKRTAQKRYQAVLALRKEYVKATPGAVVIFDFLEQHWPKLVNGIESEFIPRTNNAVELVIRRFDQHYQNFCGFESIESAQLFLGVFEKLYRFTPFSQDAQPRIRGKCPLELAGYDIRQVPMAALCTGLSIMWPLEMPDVPNL